MSQNLPIQAEITDSKRLQALYKTRLLDSKPEATFDQFTYLAQCLLDTPISLFTLLDKDRQYFKSNQGVEEHVGPLLETPLSYSLCQYVVTSAQPMSVNNATRNNLLCDNLAVAELGVVAYIGAPIYTRKGYVIGSLCGIDMRQREWTPDHHKQLLALAELVMTELDLREQLAARKKAEALTIRKADALEKANMQLKASLEKEQQLTSERDMAIDASRLKSQFLATVSHEIRTPLNGVIGMASLLSHTTLSDEQKEFVEIINASGDHLLAVINNILDLSKIEANKIDLEENPFSLKQITANICNLFYPQASNKNLTFECLVDDALPSPVFGDAMRFQQILTNLVSNAIKFTDKGSVRLTITPTRESQNELVIKAEVSDTGIGIPPDKIDRLFKPFSQLDNSTTRKYGGSGLGLAISNRLVGLMGGSMYVRSEPGTGSNFGFEVAFRLHSMN